MSRDRTERGWAAQRRKIGPLALTIALHVIILTLLLLQKGNPIPRLIEPALTTIALPAGDDSDEEPAKAEAKEQPKTEDSKVAERQPVPEPPKTPPVAPEAPEVPIGPSWLTMSRAEFAASNIANMPRAAKAGPPAPDGGDSKTAYGAGEGPGGVKLYDPDWYRRPTDAQLSGYLPPNAPHQGWGLVACQTVANYHVDNCQTLGELPLGSGFGRAVREAAWQFLVLPPRINGKPMIGAWVRIRISYGETDDPG